MKYKPDIEPEDAESEVMIRLEWEGGTPLLRASKDGNVWWSVVELTSDGTLYRYTSIPGDLGFQLDSKRRISVGQDSNHADH